MLDRGQHPATAPSPQPWSPSATASPGLPRPTSSAAAIRTARSTSSAARHGALQPDGHLPPGLRPVRHAGSVPARGESRHDEHAITAWLNTYATAIDTSARRVRLETGDTLSYERLILAMGSSSARPVDRRASGRRVHSSCGKPRRDGHSQLRPGTCAAGDRPWAAVCSGSRRLCALQELGLHVTLLERGPRLLARQFDERTGAARGAPRRARNRVFGLGRAGGHGAGLAKGCGG